MGAWGQAAFQNDLALDILEEISELDSAAKAEKIREVLTEGLESAPDNAPLAHEVIAAATLLAIVLPGGLALVIELPDADERLSASIDPDDQQYANDEWFPALLRSPGVDLIELALRSVNHVTAVDSDWRSVWGDRDRELALEEVGKVIAVLERAVR
ncbi:DUF4259 domain-containing protein [Actinoplanes derwentensis]|uniref:DUF4259 domain-containing protein n=1 Tax=Actinoplanes derwentensis TaxID=113562 RepID=A0A1H2DDF0_9ACTN|nr:DUF4259 domain-containing protein [Actinoplanes derwentensis]GID90570.1 hypothetical protein Ade03nite_94940 [Actinoplanes derwentensis]SDT80617.1 protein of unknown function [Actinoplanes derwentensis]